MYQANTNQKKNDTVILYLQIQFNAKKMLHTDERNT